MKAEDIVKALAECMPACLVVPGCGLCYMPAKIIPLDDGVKYQFTHAQSCPVDMAKRWVAENACPPGTHRINMATLTCSVCGKAEGKQ